MYINIVIVKCLKYHLGLQLSISMETGSCQGWPGKWRDGGARVASKVQFTTGLVSRIKGSEL